MNGYLSRCESVLPHCLYCKFSCALVRNNLVFHVFDVTFSMQKSTSSFFANSSVPLHENSEAFTFAVTYNLQNLAFSFFCKLQCASFFNILFISSVATYNLQNITFSIFCKLQCASCELIWKFFWLQPITCKILLFPYFASYSVPRLNWYEKFFGCNL